MKLNVVARGAVVLTSGGKISSVDLAGTGPLIRLMELCSRGTAAGLKCWT